MTRLRARIAERLLQAQATAAIHTTFWGDLYAVIGEASGEHGGYVTRIYFNPLIAWIWGGIAIIGVGGVLSLTDRRHRVGAPVRRRMATGLGATAIGR